MKTVFTGIRRKMLSNKLHGFSIDSSQSVDNFCFKRACISGYVSGTSSFYKNGGQERLILVLITWDFWVTLGK